MGRRSHGAVTAQRGNDYWYKIAISNNVGGVKHCLSTLRPALGKSAISL